MSWLNVAGRAADPFAPIAKLSHALFAGRGAHAIEGPAAPSSEAFRTLSKAVEAPRHELFRRIHFATGGTATLVKIWEDLHKYSQHALDLQAVDDNFAHLLYS